MAGLAVIRNVNLAKWKIFFYL